MRAREIKGFSAPVLLSPALGSGLKAQARGQRSPPLPYKRRPGAQVLGISSLP